MDALEDGSVTVMRACRDLHLNTIHCSESLLLQFVLSEFLSVYGAAKELHAAVGLLRCEGGFEAGNFEGVVGLLGVLVGRSQEAMRLFSWGEERGYLQKLGSYLTLIYKADSAAVEGEKALHREVSKSLLHGVELHEVVCAIAERGEGLSLEKLEEVASRERKFFAQIERCAALIPQLVAAFPFDENLLFFLLRHKEKIDCLFSSGYTRDLICAVTEKSCEELQMVVKERYRERGFHFLLPLITKKIGELQEI